MHLGPNRLDRELPQRALAVRLNLLLRRSKGAVLALANVKVEEVDHGEDVAVLIRVDDESELFEEEFGVRLGRRAVDLVVHDETTFAGDGLEDELVLRGVTLLCDQVCKLDDGLVDRVAGEGLGVGVEVDGEGLELGKLVDAVLRRGDEAGMPELVGRDGGEAGEGKAGGERVSRDRKLVLVANVDVADLRTSGKGGASAPRFLLPLSELRCQRTSICKLSTILVIRLAVKLSFFFSSSSLIPALGCDVIISAFSSFSCLAACARASSSSGVAFEESVGTARR